MRNVFLRDLTICVLGGLEEQIKWVNTFSTKEVLVDVPFYYSLAGDERFLLDTFQDDIVSENRFVELNTDIIPRGHLTFTGASIRSDEFANPNVWLRAFVENKKEFRNILAKMRTIPITVSYDLEILLANELDTFNCTQALLDNMWLYKYIYFEYNHMNIDAVIHIPDSNTIEIDRNRNMSSDTSVKLKLSFEVHTYYPSWRKDRVNIDSPVLYSSGMTDLNGYSTSGVYSNYFPNGSTGSTGSFNGTYPIGSSPTDNSDYFMYTPKRSRWFNNILKGGENGNSPDDSNNN